jgi:hypothetical protein
MIKMTRDAIAALVQKPTLPRDAMPGLGTCFYRAAFGRHVLMHLGIEACITIGTAVLGWAQQSIA